MKSIKVVIGSNWGDEGKGLMTDYLASQCNNGIVIRFNGGSQAGHTIVTPNGLRHVFNHFGSGTLVGLPTYLSEFFIVNPMTFKKEYRALREKKVSPVAYINPKCLVTTPYDIMINQIVESTRNENRHGSCGLGINETIKRSEKLTIQFSDLCDRNELSKKLFAIRDTYVKNRLHELGVNIIPSLYVDLLENDNIIINYLNDVEYLTFNSILAENCILDSYNNLIFEGGQGLLLDQNNIEYFPHLTPSNTGMQNVSKILKDMNYKENIEIVYITRCYMTRHGAGHMPNELPNKPYDNIVDLTNIPNDYQGSLRFGLLDIDYLCQTIQKDLQFTKDLQYNMSIAITCLDQIDDKVVYISDNKRVESDRVAFIDKLLTRLNVDCGYLSYGTTRDTIYQYNNKEVFRCL